LIFCDPIVDFLRLQPTFLVLSGHSNLWNFLDFILALPRLSLTFLELRQHFWTFQFEQIARSVPFVRRVLSKVTVSHQKVAVDGLSGVVAMDEEKCGCQDQEDINEKLD
jgi:hypothetical protein